MWAQARHLGVRVSSLWAPLWRGAHAETQEGLITHHTELQLKKKKEGTDHTSHRIADPIQKMAHHV